MVFTFDNETVVATGDTLECPSKKASLLISEIEIFMGNRQKRAVGIREDTMKPCYIWEDDHYVHIDCLKETKDNFQRKFVELIKNLNR